MRTFITAARLYSGYKLKALSSLVFLTMIEAFGTERIMIGSDWPVCTLSGDYQSTMRIVIDYIRKFQPEVREAILGGNCARFYGLDAMTPKGRL